MTWHGEADAVGRPLDADLLPGLGAAFAELEARGREAVDAASPALRGARLEVVRRLDLRYRGTETPLTLVLGPEDGDEAHLRARFHAIHRRELGHHRPDHPIRR